ncbi:hypothetical protein BCR34DRAFT_669129 [Clohesyomyces aquaticus]|uniref:Uncharacterized protein n=1 Tax=Clohesyomyces aquaticus TaxID=1231657 RepID=A0A1Y1YFR1_9PLEO|nr:hypothetical protein BCR34DRAFT_669129 [Clohesyomyces aquaticus]
MAAKLELGEAERQWKVPQELVQIRSNENHFIEMMRGLRLEITIPPAIETALQEAESEREKRALIEAETISGRNEVRHLAEDLEVWDNAENALEYDPAQAQISPPSKVILEISRRIIRRIVPWISRWAVILILCTFPTLVSALNENGQPRKQQSRHTNCTNVAIMILSTFLLEHIGETALPFIMAGLFLSFPNINTDSRSSSALKIGVYLGSLAATTAYSYIAFASHYHPSVPVSLILVLSASVGLAILVRSADGMQSVITFTPMILSLTIFLVIQFSAIRGYFIDRGRDARDLVGNVTQRCLRYVGRHLIAVGEAPRPLLPSNQGDLDDGRERADS